MYDDAGLEIFVVNRIKGLFAQGGLTAYRFSVITGIPRTTISDYLNERTCPSLYFIGVLCKYMNLTQEEFYRGYDEGLSGKRVAYEAVASDLDGKIKHECTMRMLEKISRQIEALSTENLILQ